MQEIFNISRLKKVRDHFCRCRKGSEKCTIYQEKNYQLFKSRQEFYYPEKVYLKIFDIKHTSGEIAHAFSVKSRTNALYHFFITNEIRKQIIILEQKYVHFFYSDAIIMIENPKDQLELGGQQFPEDKTNIKKINDVCLYTNC